VADRPGRRGESDDALRAGARPEQLDLAFEPCDADGPFLLAPGWDRFELNTLRRIGTALGARLEVRLIPARSQSATARRPSTKALVKALTPLFWDRPLRESDLTSYAGWVIERVLTSGDLSQVRAARAFYGDEALGRALERPGLDLRTRQYWRLMLEGKKNAPQSPPA